MKNKTRIERTYRGKIKQYSPAKLERLYRYFNGKAKEERREGRVLAVRFNGGPEFRLRV